MQSKQHSKLNDVTMDDVRSYVSQSESNHMIDLVQKSHFEMWNDDHHRLRAVSCPSSDVSDGEYEADSEEEPSSFAEFKTVYTISLHYGDRTNETVRCDPTMDVSRISANQRKLTPRSFKPTPTKITKHYKQKKAALQIADPETTTTCSITRVTSSNKKGGRKSVRRVSFLVGGEPAAVL